MAETNHPELLAGPRPPQSGLDLPVASDDLPVVEKERARLACANLAIAIHDLDFVRARILVGELDSLVSLMDRSAPLHPAPWRNPIAEFDDEAVHAEFLETLRERRLRNAPVDVEAEG